MPPKAAHDLLINVNKYNLLHAGCYIELPRKIKLKKAFNQRSSNQRSIYGQCVLRVVSSGRSASG